MKVSFLGIGVQKGATSWLRHCLSTHPEVFIPSLEPHFFNRPLERRRGVNFYHARWFKKAKPYHICGEITPNYIYFKSTAEAIIKYNPDMKLILILREPTSRAISQYQMEVAKAMWNPRRKGGTAYAQSCGLKYAFDNDLAYIRTYGHYKEQIARYNKVVPLGNLLVWKYEDIENGGQVFLDAVCEHIGVSQFIFPDAARRIQTIYSKNPKKNEHIHQARKDVSIRSDHIEYVKKYYRDIKLNDK